MKKHLLLGLGICLLQSTAWSAEITVAAAASLTDAFKVMAQRFEKQNPNTKVNVTFGSSGTILQQLRYGAPIDVFASADEQTMNDAEKMALVQQQTRTDFTNNSLVLITSTEKPVLVKSLKDLTRNDIQHIALGNPAHTPAGRYAQATLQKQGLWNNLQSKMIYTQNVRQALDYVARAETQAGFVFSSDVLSQKSKVRVIFKVPTEIAIRYPIAVTKTSKDVQQAQQFIRYVKSAEGQNILRQYGFQ
ncbi:molybdate ABC transporter substrate-binding protein [Acinetobacter sp. MD2(2019)]|uniref:molybdate ABC transporter substrate-binding protein n=1 Tax=Acinetobacter sp. MD2(2019) TaxID=2605273 RepID=UPI002D1E4BDC|nr:molybdate ABC transporter substrate-binding protein [Acinetobacter sp. MD2(2019)]MEB3752795.1 molybdate ABC transporter substrate-binding protein [Acinetobacter sp. MD2(2019)]